MPAHFSRGPISPSRARSLTRAVLAALLGAAACAPHPAVVAPPSPAPAPPKPAVMLRCPNETDGPSILATALEDAHRAFAGDPSTPLPPACVLAAFARVPGVVPESLDTHALSLAAELERRGADQRELLTGEILILARRQRSDELWRAYERLAVLDSQPPINIVRLAASAALVRKDSASLLMLLARASARADAPSAIRNEAAVLRQVPALWSAVNQARGLIRQNPKYVAAYPSLIANFGTLGLTDSVVAYARRGLANGATRAALTPMMESLVNAALRHASLYAGVFDWDVAIASAQRADSALASPSTKYLAASLIAQSAAPRIAQADALIRGPSWWPRANNTTAPDALASRADGCARAGALGVALGVAEAALRDGGDRYPGGVPELTSALTTARGRVASLVEGCSR